MSMAVTRRPTRKDHVPKRRRPPSSQSPRADATSQPDIVTPPAGSLPGRVVRAFGLWHEVRLEDRTLLCTMRGLLKRRRQRTDIVAVGDQVWVTDLGGDEGVIEAVEPRTRVLARTARNTDDVEQVILANLDQALFVFAVHDPEPHVRMLDRFLILAELQGLPARIAANKIDLDNPPGHAAELFCPYTGAYPIHYVSVRSGAGLNDLRAALAGRVTAVAGPSGVGKSSLLNALHPDGDRTIGDISEATGKGRHTTTATRLYEIGPATFVADTPGMRALAMHAVDADRLPGCFPELRPYLDQCFYPDCTHVIEAGCAVREAVGAGAIPLLRYESYVALRTGDEVRQ